MLKSGSYTKHFYIEGQRIVSKLGDGLGDATKTKKAGSDKVNYQTKYDGAIEGIVRNLKFLGQDGAILTAGKSGKVPPGQILGNGNNGGGNNGKDNEQFQYYFHPDHLGSTSYITDASGEVYQHLEYFAFGETFVEEHSNTDRTPYLYNGKELDEETGLYYYGARYYDPRTSMFPSVDRFTEKYSGLSSYQYAANNPIKYIDVNGDSVNIGSMLDENQQALIKSHERSTGLNIGTDGGNLTYQKDDRGRAIINRDGNGKKIGSRKARKALIKAINDENTLLVTDIVAKNGSFAIANENIINLDPMQIGENMGNVQGIERETVGWSMTFFHEYSHTAIGGLKVDPNPQTVASDPKGGAVSFTNSIRRQLGYSTRSQYSPSVGVNSDGTIRHTSHFKGGSTYNTKSSERSYGITQGQYGQYVNFLRR